MTKIKEEIILECKRMYEEDHISCAQIAKHFGIGSATVRRRLKALGVEIIQHPHAGIFDTKEVLKLYEGGTPIWKIAKKFKSSEETISKVLKEQGVTVKKKLVFDEHIFDSIDTEEKAYWLGFIWADGCVVNSYVERKSCSVEIGISIKDFNHLEKFCEFIGLPKDRIHIRKTKETTVNGKLVNPGLSCRVQLSSKHMWNQLINLGCCPNKTYNEIFPCLDIFKTPDLIHHFIRGFFDGDGWVYIDCQNHLITGICGQEQFLIELRKLLPVKLQNISLYKIPNTEVIRVLKWAVDNSKIFLNYIYKDATIWLDRKFNISAPYISNSISKSVNIGETPEMDNTEITTETKESVAS